MREAVEYITKQEDVWVATRKDIASHFRENFPYERRRRDRDGRDGNDGRGGRL